MNPPAASFLEVPSPPPPAHLERIPPRPHEASVWLDGSWDWTGTRWRWKDGGWFAAPAPGVVYSQWETRRPGDTRLLFAQGVWRDRSGAAVPGPKLLVSATIESTSEGDAAVQASTEASETSDAGFMDADIGEAGLSSPLAAAADGATP